MPLPSWFPAQRFPSKRQIFLGIAFLGSLLVPLLLSGVGLFLSLWIVIPAPTFALLPLGVGTPEVSSWLLVVNAIALILAVINLPKGWVYTLALVASVIGLVLSSLPLVQFPATSARFVAEMQTALGADYLGKISSESQRQMRSSPLVIADVFRGIPADPVRTLRGIPFAAPAGVGLKLNVYQPLAVGTYPTLVIIYGGAWRTGTPDNDEAFSRYMAARGYTVVAIDYRHAPDYQFPAQIEDVRTAIAYLQQHANELEIDLTRLAVMGRSAGAHLSMLLAYQPGDVTIRAVVNYYGPVDLTAGYNDPPVPDPIDTHTVLEDFLGGPPTDRPALYQQASPINYVTRSLPPTLLIYGDRDHIVQSKFGQALYRRLRQTNNLAIWLNIPWAEHAFDAVFNGVSSQLALYHTERFLAWALK